jgi:hypothetical protein
MGWFGRKFDGVRGELKGFEGSRGELVYDFRVGFGIGMAFQSEKASIQERIPRWLKCNCPSECPVIGIYRQGKMQMCIKNSLRPRNVTSFDTSKGHK